MKNARGFSEETIILYNRELLSKRFSRHVIIKIQDEFVLNCENVVFIEYEPEKREKIRNYIRKIICNDTHLIILGNHDMIPFESVKSPVNDGDAAVYTDNYWNSFDRQYLIPDFPMSRIPISSCQSEKELISMIGRLMAARTVTRRERLGITASIWDRAAIHVFKSVKGTGEMLVSPPFSVKNDGILTFRDFSGTLYCNVHGSDTEKGWYGQAKNNETQYERFPLALLPETFTSGFDSTYLVSEACYGGLINDRRIDDSIALSAVCKGLIFTLLSTSTAYGTFFPPLSEADLLVEIFYKCVYRGMTAGKSLVKAKRDFASRNIEKNGFLDNDDKKTLLEFLLYGNPLVQEER